MIFWLSALGVAAAIIAVFVGFGRYLTNRWKK